MAQKLTERRTQQAVEAAAVALLDARQAASARASSSDHGIQRL